MTDYHFAFDVTFKGLFSKFQQFRAWNLQVNNICGSLWFVTRSLNALFCLLGMFLFLY